MNGYAKAKVMALLLILTLIMLAWPLGHALDWLFSKLEDLFILAREDKASGSRPMRPGEERGVIIYRIEHISLEPRLGYTSRHER